MGAGTGRPPLDRLFAAALEAAIARVERDGHFFPLLFELRANGAIQTVAVLETGAIHGAQSVLDRLVELLRPRAADGTIRAAAIVLHRAADSAIEVRLRAEGRAEDVRIPFAIASSGMLRRRRKLTLGEFERRAVPNELF